MKVRIKPTERILELDKDNMVLVSKKSLERLLLEAFYLFSEELNGVQDLNEQELNERYKHITNKLLQFINALGAARKGDLNKKKK